MKIRTAVAAAVLASAAAVIPAVGASASVAPMPHVTSFVAHVISKPKNPTILETGAHVFAGEHIRLHGGQRFTISTASWNGGGTVFTVSPLPTGLAGKTVLFTVG